MDDRVVYSTPWFDLVARYSPADRDPHYLVRTSDYVIVVALTVERRLILVHQYRPVVGAVMLELPAGHVEPGESPEQAARKELLEETGYVAGACELLGDLTPDPGRLGNRLWCFLAPDAAPTRDPAYRPESGIEPVVYDRGLPELLAEGDFSSALNYAALLLAAVRGGLPIARAPADATG
jgi:ADP-ribose pyrophosphatase